MNTRHYAFEMQCPRCRKDFVIHGTKESLPPRVNCGDCLMDDIEVVEFKVVRVHVIDDIKGAY